jgi:type I restriction enzyme S subunit
MWNPLAHSRTIRYVDVSAVSRERACIESSTQYDAPTAPGRARKIIKHGDTIFATIRPSLRRIAKVPRELDNEIASTAFCVLRANTELIDPDYLFYCVCDDRFVDRVVAHESGASYPAVRDKDVLAELISLPSISEQVAIATVLRRVRESALRQYTLLECAYALKMGAMRKVFTHGLRGERSKETELGRIPESWQCASIGDHFAVVSGGTPSRANADYWRHGTIPWVKTTEIDYRIITNTEERITELGLNGSAAKMLAPGTILLAMYGQGVTRGKVSMLGIEAACNQACAAMAPLDGAVIPRYLFHFLTYRYEDIRRLAHGGQQQNLNLDIVRAVPIVHSADTREQTEIVELLDAIDRKIGLHQHKKAVLEKLFKALLSGFMSGNVRVSDLDLTAVDGLIEERKTADAPTPPAV